MPLNDSTLTFLAGVEKYVRAVLPQYTTSSTTNKGAFEEEIIEKIIKNCGVQFHWSLLSQDTDKDEDGRILLKDTVQLLVTVTRFSMAASWMELYKTNAQKTSQKSTSLHRSVSGVF